MRENTKWIMLVTALAFVALMVFEWGMDVTGQSGGGLGEIGSVNGTPVMYEDYQATLQQLFDRAQAQQLEPLSSQQNADLEDAAFDQVVNQILVAQELERRGIRVSDEEIRQAARFNPPPEIRQIFQTDEGFDLQQYQQYLASPNADPQILLYLESYFRDQIPRAKLLRQVSTGVYLTEEELWRMWKADNEQVEIRYVTFDPETRVPDDAVEVSPEEIREYYEENQEEFEVPAQATVKATVLSKTPTPADSAAARERAEGIVSELREGADWGEVAARESADATTASEGGELGVFTPGDMVPAFDSAAFQGPVGEVQGPIRSSFGYHVVEVEERWASDSVQARHVLVPIRRTDDSEIELLTRADSLEDLAENLPLEEAAGQLGLETIRDARITTDFAFISGVGQIGEGADWAFEEASPGDVSPVFETTQAFYALELVERTPAGILPLEEAEASIRATLAFEKKVERVMEEAESLLATIRGGASFDQAVADAGLTLRTAGPFTRSEFVPGIGRENRAIGTAFGLDEGEVSDVVRTPNNVFVMRQVGRMAADSSAWAAQKDAQRQRAISRLQQERLQQWLEGLRAQADIVDRRDDVLQPADPDAEPPRPGGGFGF